MSPLDQIVPACGGDCRSCASVGSCPDRVVCRCLRVTEEAVISAIRDGGLATLREVRQATDAGGGCTCCHRELRHYLSVYAPRAAVTSPC